MVFRFKQFSVRHDASAMKVGTDGVTLGAWARCAGRVLDVGCGCGLIGLMAAQRGADRVVMVEIDPGAAKEATENAARSPWADRIEVVQGDYGAFGPSVLQNSHVLTPVGTLGASVLSPQRLQLIDMQMPTLRTLEPSVPTKKGEIKSAPSYATHSLLYDSIMSNPPFFAEGEVAPDGARAQARHEFSLPPERFMGRSAQLLAAEGSVSIIIPPDREAAWTAAAALAGLYPSRRCELFTRLRSTEPRRLLMEFRREVTAAENSSLRIPTQEYKDLVNDFYL